MKILIFLLCCFIIIRIIYCYRHILLKPGTLDPSPKKGKEISYNSKPTTYSIVVARYNEDLDWLVGNDLIKYLENISIEPKINLYIYLKSDKPLNISKNILQKYYTNIHIEKLKNVGMCAQTYLYHIYKNYDNLEDVTFFVPGSAANNIKINLLKDLFENGYKYYWYFTFVRYEYFLTYFKISNYVVTEEKNQSGENNIMKISDIRPFGDWYTHYVKRELETNETNHKDIFSLHSSIIRKLPKKFYKDMNILLSKHTNPEDCHFIERMWYPLYSSL